jgi:hypothetical protein
MTALLTLSGALPLLDALAIFYGPVAVLVGVLWWLDR